MSEQQSSQTLSGRQIAQAAGFVVIGFILSRLLGLLREGLLASVFGGGFVYDAYAAALRPPETILLVVAGGALGSAFIPTFTDYIAQGKREEGWRLTNAVLTLISIVLVVVVALAWVFARPIVTVSIGRDFPPEVQALTVELLRIMLITPVIFGIGGLFMALLNAQQRFLMPALAPGVYNLGIIAGAMLLGPSIGIQGAAWGSVLGALGYVLIQIPAVAATGLRLRPVLDVLDPGVREVARLMGPRVLGLAIVQLNFWVNITLATGMTEGSVSAVNRAFQVMLLPLGLIAQSVAIAVFPTFAAQVSEGDTPALRRTLGQVLRSVMFLAIPATVGLIMLRLPIVRLIYERNAFTFENSQAVAWALLFYALGLASHALVEILTRAYYALHDTWTPVVIGGGAMALNVGLSFALITVIGDPQDLTRGAFGGLALANTIATTLEGVLLLVVLRPRLNGLHEARLAGSVGRALAASVVMALVLWGLSPLTELLGLLVGTAILIAAGGMVYWAGAWLLGSEEARLFTGVVLNRLRRTTAE